VSPIRLDGLSPGRRFQERAMSRQPHDRTERSETDARLGRAWREHRRYVLDIALRMLGDLGDAEDVVQEAFTRLFRTDIDELEDVRAWLVTVVSRLCLDQLRSVRRQRQAPLDTDGGREPIPSASSVAGLGDPRARGAAAAGAPGVDPADRVTLDDSVRLALQVMLQRLSPAERTAFVLHDVFRLSFDDIAGIVGRSPAACRQLASRARRQVRSDANPARFTVESPEQRAVTERFIAACTTGDIEALLAVLDPDVAGQADIGGRVGLLPPVVGRDAVVRGILVFFGPDSGMTLLSVPTPGQPSVLALREDGDAFALVTLTIEHGAVEHIHSVVDPAQLAPVNDALRG
jgi:RNA polymerase sigma-70 factor, ECF subfamily